VSVNVEKTHDTGERMLKGIAASLPLPPENYTSSETQVKQIALHIFAMPLITFRDCKLTLGHINK
jgi:hypothetical protein